MKQIVPGRAEKNKYSVGGMRRVGCVSKKIKAAFNVLWSCEKQLTNRPTNEMEQQSQRKKRKRERETDRYKHNATNATIHKDMAIVFQFVVAVAATVAVVCIF